MPVWLLFPGLLWHQVALALFKFYAELLPFIFWPFIFLYAGLFRAVFLACSFSCLLSLALLAFLVACCCRSRITFCIASWFRASSSVCGAWSRNTSTYPFVVWSCSTRLLACTSPWDSARHPSLCNWAPFQSAFQASKRDLQNRPANSISWDGIFRPFSCFRGPLLAWILYWISQNS